MKYDLVAFDMDGTIIDTDLMIVLTMLDLYKKYRPGFKPLLNDIVYFSGPPLEDTMRKEFPNEDVNKMKKEFASISLSYYEATAVAFPYTKDFILELKKAGVRVAVITSKLRKAAEFALQITGLDSLFELLIGGDDVANPKPDPEGLLETMDFFRIRDKSKVLYIGDTLFDYETARRAGVSCALVDWNTRRLPKDAKPDYIVSSYKEFINELK